MDFLTLKHYLRANLCLAVPGECGTIAAGDSGANPDANESTPESDMVCRVRELRV